MKNIALGAIAASVFCAQASVIGITADFRGETPPNRAMRDIKFPCDLSNAAGVEFDMKVEDRTEFSMFSYHLDCDGVWVSVNADTISGGEWNRIALKRPKDRKDWSKTRGIRVSGWRGGTNCTSIAIRNISVSPVVPEHELSKQEKADRQRGIDATNRLALARLAAIPAPDGERRMVWAHRPTAMRDRTWDQALRIIKRGGYTDLIANLALGPVAAYKSDVLLTTAKYDGRDCLEECLSACRRHGVKLHVWICCWRTGWGISGEDVARFESEGRFQRSNAGVKKDWLCPSHPANRKMLVDSMLELAKKGVDGVHFDYIRYPDCSYCFCDGCKMRFEERIGRKLSGWPKVLQRDRALDRAWREFRRDTITAPVAEVSGRIHREHPGVEVSAAVFISPTADWDLMGQDWGTWCEKGYLDFVCPMTYADSLESFSGRLRKLRTEVTPNVPMYPGIGLGVWKRDGLDAKKFSDQVCHLRENGGKGFSVFDLSWRLERLVNTVSDFGRRNGK